MFIVGILAALLFVFGGAFVGHRADPEDSGWAIGFLIGLLPALFSMAFAVEFAGGVS